MAKECLPTWGPKLDQGNGESADDGCIDVYGSIVGQNGRGALIVVKKRRLVADWLSYSCVVDAIFGARVEFTAVTAMAARAGRGGRVRKGE